MSGSPASLRSVRRSVACAHENCATATGRRGGDGDAPAVSELDEMPAAKRVDGKVDGGGSPVTESAWSSVAPTRRSSAGRPCGRGRRSVGPWRRKRASRVVGEAVRDERAVVVGEDLATARFRGDDATGEVCGVRLAGRCRRGRCRPAGARRALSRLPSSGWRGNQPGLAGASAARRRVERSRRHLGAVLRGASTVTILPRCQRLAPAGDAPSGAIHHRSAAERGHRQEEARCRW